MNHVHMCIYLYMNNLRLFQKIKQKRKNEVYKSKVLIVIQQQQQQQGLILLCTKCEKPKELVKRMVKSNRNRNRNRNRNKKKPLSVNW